MPTYEYECKSCGHSFEAFQSMRDDPLQVCPQCGKAIRRVINAGAGIIFKGSGFYVTDKNKKSGTAAKAAPAKAEGQTACESCAAAESGACAGNSVGAQAAAS